MISMDYSPYNPEALKMDRFDTFVTELRRRYSRWIDKKLIDDLEHWWDSERYDKAFTVAAKICRKIPDKERSKEFDEAIEMLRQKTMMPRTTYQQRIIQPRTPIGRPGRGLHHHVKGNGLKRQQEEDDCLAKIYCYFKILSRGIKEENPSDLELVQRMSVSLLCQKELRDIAINSEKLIARIKLFEYHIERISYNIKYLARGESDVESESYKKDLKDVSQVWQILNDIEDNVEAISEEIEFLSKQVKSYERKLYSQQKSLETRNTPHLKEHENAKLKKELQSLHERNTNLKNQLEMKEKQIKKKNALLLANEKKDDVRNVEYSQENSKLKEDLKRQRNENQENLVRYETEKQKNNQLEAAIGLLRQEKEGSVSSFEKNKLKVNQLQSELQRIQEENKELCRRLKESQNNATALQTLQEILGQTFNEMKKLQADNQQLKVRYKKSEEMLENAQSELQNAITQHDDLQKRHTEIQRSQLKLRSEQNEEELKYENMTLKEKLQVRERELQNMKKEIEHLKEKSHDHQDSKQELERQLNKSEKMVENTQRELQNAICQRNDLQKRIELDRENKQLLENKVRQLGRETEELTKRLKESRDNATTMQTLKENLAQNDSERTKHQDDKQELERQLNKSEKMVENTQRELQNAICQRNDLQKRIELDRENKQLLENKVRQLGRETEELTKRLKESRDNATTMQTLKENLAQNDSERTKHQDDKQKLERMLNESEKMVENAQRDLQDAISEREDLQKRNIKLQKQLQGRERDLRTMEQEIEYLKEKNDDLQNRFSKVAAAQLTHDNPNIADLSDTNRPTKLSESFSELYDNEWTEAFDEIEDNSSSLPEESIVQQLRDILLTCYKHCSEVSQTQLNGLKALLISPNAGNLSARHDLTAEQSKTVFDLRKRTYNVAIASIQKEMTSMYSESGKYHSLKVFIEKCTELCWLMVVQSPPVYLDGSHKSGNIFDKDVFKAYTRSGHVIDYVVWPPLYLHSGGPLLCKGTAQGKL